MVSQVTSRPTITVLNLHQPYSKLSMAAVIFATTAASFEFYEASNFRTARAAAPGICWNQREPKREPKVFGMAGNCWQRLEIVRLIQTRNADNLLVSAAVIEVTAAERFKRDLGSLEDLVDSDPCLHFLSG
jgi:hypothetical protein